MGEITYYTSWDAQYMEGFGHKIQVLKLNPSAFSLQPSSNIHNRWTQVPEYRIILRHGNNVSVEQIKAFIAYYKSNLIDTYPARFKRYKIR